jgi:hypothetical protein
MNIRIITIAAATAATLGSAEAEQAADDHLGTVHFPISCSAVQAKFNRAARATGSVEAAKRYYRALTVFAVGGDGDRPEVAEARTYLAQN